MTDSICLKCGTIVNSYWEDNCTTCSCGGNYFLSGKIVIDIRNLLELHLDDLKILTVTNGFSIGSRPKMVFKLINKRYPLPVNIKEIDENLFRKMILRNRKKFWYMRDIDNFLHRHHHTKIIRTDTF